jgi:mRNA interferase RelE/StbE
MGWKIEITPEAEAGLEKLGTAEARRILSFLHTRLQNMENPRDSGKLLKGVLREFWRYRVGDYRILCRIEDNVLTVFVVQIEHRSKVYNRKRKK